MSETFEITSVEGLPIRGSFDVAENARALLVVVHGFKGFKEWGFFPWLGEMFPLSRIGVCRFNMSRSGIGDNPDTFERLDLFAGDTYSKQISDLELVVRHARDQFSSLPLFLLGHSRGGGVALLAAEHIPDLRAIITWSAISRVDRWDEETKRQWRRDGFYDVLNARTRQMMRMSTEILDDYEAHRERLDILGATSRLPCPLLVIHGAADESVPATEASEIFGAARNASRVLIGGASHTYNAIHPLVNVPFPLHLAAALTAQFVAAHAR